MAAAGMLSGFGSPISYPGQQTAWGFSPYGGQAISAQPSFQHIPHLLQIVPQQLQHLHYLQQQQLQLLQQLLHVVPQQIHHLQQVIQFVPQQIQQLQQQLQAQQGPFGPAAPTQGFGTPFQSAPFFGLQGVPGQPGHVM